MLSDHLCPFMKQTVLLPLQTYCSEKSLAPSSYLPPLLNVEDMLNHFTAKPNLAWYHESLHYNIHSSMLGQVISASLWEIPSGDFGDKW